LVVSNTNDAPVVANAIADQAAAQGTAFAFAVPANTFADIEIGRASCRERALADGSPLPAWLGFDAATATFSGTPGNGDVAGLTVRVTAADGSAAAVCADVALVVSNTNDAPVVANAIADQAATQGTAFAFAVPANTFADI